MMPIPLTCATVSPSQCLCVVESHPYCLNVEVDDYLHVTKVIVHVMVCLLRRHVGAYQCFFAGRYFMRRVGIRS